LPICFVAWPLESACLLDNRRSRLFPRSKDCDSASQSMTVWTALLLGLVGSLHCAGMCGPLSLAVPANCQSFAGFARSRLAYNLGRIITYCLLGLLFGLLGRTLVLAGVQRWVCLALGLVLLAGLLSSWTRSLRSPVISVIETLKSGMSGLLRRRGFGSLLLLGCLNGFLPCGLVYV